MICNNSLTFALISVLVAVRLAFVLVVPVWRWLLMILAVVSVRSCPLSVVGVAAVSCRAFRWRFAVDPCLLLSSRAVVIGYLLTALKSSVLSLQHPRGHLHAKVLPYYPSIPRKYNALYQSDRTRRKGYLVVSEKVESIGSLRYFYIRNGRAYKIQEGKLT